MSAAKKITPKPELSLVVVSVLQETEQTSKELILKWAEDVQKVATNKSLSLTQRIRAIKNLGMPEPVRVFFFKLMKSAANKAWINQSWARRLGIIGIAAGATIGGSVGVATSGVGFGVAAWLASSAALTYIGVIIDETKKELKGKGDEK